MTKLLFKCLYLGWCCRICSSRRFPLLITLGQVIFGFAVILISSLFSKKTILKVVVSLLGPTILGEWCSSILFVDHKLFWSCCNLIRVEIPNKLGSLIRIKKLEIWC